MLVDDLCFLWGRVEQSWTVEQLKTFITQQISDSSPLLPSVDIYHAQAWGFSREFSFLAPTETGPLAVVRLLATADMGHAEVCMGYGVRL